ncbi:hypothetical protein P7D22_19470 [Lichenihabitans sp. Uapishka_5]|uniref:hypothetical protein n=1 Tax=Lichenihabitans sp. Uapishka_5 TaxID=3037302 RepID=UPI0029E80B16|nr:hypothetical protein [Lichenihabitans sp. Uapishka_5]MDX7953348.1 hypothetical protein [Lichenihabitans sp. Uapishka_5]
MAQEAESERAGLVNTLDRLRENLRPENMVDEMFSQAQANSSDITDKVWGIVRANPIPAALIGLGAAMLAGVGQRFGSSARQRPNATYDDALYDIDAPRDLDEASLSVDPAWSHPNNARIGSFAMDRHPDHRPNSGLSRLLNEQPLILAALGMAVGAAVGSAIRSTSVESQWMGDASESVRRNASAAARDQLTQLKTKASQTLDQIKTTAAEHGVSAENVSGLVHDLGEDVRSAGLGNTSRSV